MPPRKDEDDSDQPVGDHGGDSSAQPDNDHTDNIHCTFGIASLDDEPDYEALSYVWGDADSQKPVYLHGHLFSITRNLYDALFHMRKATARALWVDALCINQDDLQERASQVAHMPHIYANASTVVVYLGDWIEAEVTFSLIETFGRDPDQHFYKDFQGPPDLDSDLVTVQRLLSKFFDLAWWARLWTVQEYILAQKVVFQSGFNLLEPSAYENFVEVIAKHGACCNRTNLYFLNSDLGTGFYKANLLCTLANVETRPSTNFFRWAADFRNRQCSDPLDKIYGILGLADASFRSQIRLDYTLTPRQLYANAAMVSVSETKSLDFLSYVYGKRAQELDLPSYVPDLTAVGFDEEDDRSQIMRCWMMLHFFSATWDTVADMSTITNSEAETHFVLFDTISRVGPDPREDPWRRFLDEGRVFADIPPHTHHRIKLGGLTGRRCVAACFTTNVTRALLRIVTYKTRTMLSSWNGSYGLGLRIVSC